MILLLSLALADGTEVVARVDGVPITRAEVDAYLAALGPETRARIGDDISIIVDQLVAGRLLERDAIARGIDQTERGRAAVTTAEREALARLVLDQVVAEQLTPSAEQAWYDGHAADFAKRQVSARHILVASEPEAKKLLREIQHGGDFAELARSHSLDSGSASEGGELGWLAAGQLVLAFADPVFAAAPGAILGPFQTSYGWHVVEVHAFRDTVPFADAEPQVRQALQDELVSTYIGQLEQHATIEHAAAPALLAPLTTGPGIPADAVRYGKAGAPVRLVVFVDLQCPHCAEMGKQLRALAAARSDVEVVYRHYPINRACNEHVGSTGHSMACDAARAVLCNPSADVLTGILERNATLDLPTIREVAGGKDPKAWTRCLALPETEARLKVDVDEGAALGIEGTPAVFVQAGSHWWRFTGGGDDLAAAVEEAERGG